MNTQNPAKEKKSRSGSNGIARNTTPGKSMKRKALSILIKIALLSAISFVLRLPMVEFSVPFFPPYLKMDFSDIPVLLGTFAFGPVNGIIIAGIKNLLIFATGLSQTLGVGELANFLFSAALLLPGCIYYYWKKTRGTSLLSLGLGATLMTALSYPLNLYLLIPFFSQVYSLEAIIGMSKAVNPALDSIGVILWYTVLFTGIKAVVVALVTFLTYKRLSRVLHM